MKKILFFITIVAVTFSCLLPACKKVTHSTNPTPDNYRLWSYTKVTTTNIIVPPTITPLVTENYRFEYDGNGKVSQIFFTSNDAAKVMTGVSELSIKFKYFNDTILKTHTDIRTTTLRETDTFIINSQGQITRAYFPNEVHFFEYYGVLLAKETVTHRDTGAAVTANLIYTSNNGDFLNRLFDGNLIAGFPDSGIRAFVSPGDLERDTILSFPLNVTWTVLKPTGEYTSVVHGGVNGYSDAFNGYPDNGVVMTAIDANGVTTRPVIVPTYNAQQFYEIYDFLNNRPGDYLQLNSFTTYGMNIYKNVHMVKQMSSPSGTTIATYTIDGDSKVTNTYVVKRDSVTKSTIEEAYKLQYETF